MLTDLRIENLAVVEHVQVQFTKGLNVISGETGAGKSILLSALQLALGVRANSDLVRVGTDAAWVEARFELSEALALSIDARLDARGLPSSGKAAGNGRSDTLVVRRRVSADGKSRVYINDASATVGALGDVTEGLVELTGQHEQFGLLRSSRHRELLDEFGGASPLVAEVGEAVRALRAAEAHCEDLREALVNRTERHEFLRFYLAEFERVKPEPGEDEALIVEANRLRHSERLRLGLSKARQALYESNASAYDQLTSAYNELRPLTAADPRLESTVSRLDGMQTDLDDLARDLAHYESDAVDEPARLEEVEARLLDLQRMCRKHGGELQDVIDKMEAARAELEQLGDLELRIDEAEAARAAAEKTALLRSAALTARRRETAPTLVEATTEHLRDLGFLRASFEIEIETAEGSDALSETGADTITFVVTTNPGQPARPLAKVASGGELSRMLLALKCALAGVVTAPVQVLDEIDTGIGGGTGEIVGRKIRQLADRAQVLCVTHLPQIASFADSHLVAVKHTAEGTTRTSLQALDAVAREEEVARMLGGTEITETTREHAREMLGRARLTGSAPSL